jgi:RHS repeat-associated protein
MISRVALPNNGQTYRFGFNGKENDNGVKGLGNQQDYGMRIYDPRVGRFLSTDPLQAKYPGLTPYQFASNSPIAHIDLDGQEKYHYTFSINDKGNPVLVPGKVEHFSEWQWKPRMGGTMLGFQLYEKVQDPRKEYYVDYAYQTYAVTDVIAVQYTQHVSVKYSSDPASMSVDKVSADVDDEIESVSNINAFRQGLAAGLSGGSRPSIPRLSRLRGSFGSTPSASANEQSAAAMSGNPAAATANTDAMMESMSQPLTKPLASLAKPKTLNPEDVHFMQSSIKNQTGEFTVTGNAAALKAGTLDPKVLTITVWKDVNGKIWTLDHRRLAAFKLAGMKEVPVQWATQSQVQQQIWKMTTNNGGTSIRLKLGNGQSQTVQ